MNSHIKCIEVGNTYSEYECQKCGKTWVQNDDAPERVHECAEVVKETERTHAIK